MLLLLGISEELFESFNFANNQQTAIEHAELPSMHRVKGYMPFTLCMLGNSQLELTRMKNNSRLFLMPVSNATGYIFNLFSLPWTQQD